MFMAVVAIFGRSQLKRNTCLTTKMVNCLTSHFVGRFPVISHPSGNRIETKVIYAMNMPKPSGFRYSAQMEHQTHTTNMQIHCKYKFGCVWDRRWNSKSGKGPLRYFNWILLHDRPLANLCGVANRATNVLLRHQIKIQIHTDCVDRMHKFTRIVLRKRQILSDWVRSAHRRQLGQFT